MKKLLPGNLFKRKKDKLGWEIISEKSYTSLIEQYQLYIKNPEENDIPKEWYPHRYNSTEGFPIIDYSNFDFSGWDFSGVSFHNCKLNGTRFHNAILVGTDLHQAVGLRSGQLAGADVTGAELPEEIKKFEGLEVIREASKNARKLFLAMLLGCVYAIITVATTTDVRLITNSSSSPLPIIGAEIPIVGFFWAAPLLLVSLYLYFHIYMQRLWERLAELPAVFPEGVPLDEKAYPWLMFGLVRKHFARLRDERPPLSGVQVLLSSLLAWWVVPGTLLMFWLRFLPRHDWLGTGLHIILLGFTAWFGIMSYWLSAGTLRGGFPRLKKPVWKKGTTRGVIGTGILVLISIGSIAGIRPDENRSDPGTWIPKALEKVAFGAFVDLEDAEVSTKPPNWTGLKEKEKEELAQVKGVQLDGFNLRHANAKGAFLANADFSNADLEGANFFDADLRDATFPMANLCNAVLVSTSLVGANLIYARLDSAELDSVDLRGADLYNASLVGAELHYARLDSAKLDSADLRGADLYNASLVEAILSDARLDSAELIYADLRGADLYNASLVGAILSDARLDSAELIYAVLRGADLHNASLVGAILSYVRFDSAELIYAVLRGADLHNASLVGADLRWSHLDSADLRSADLSGADIGRASLVGANLMYASLASANLTYADLAGTALSSASLVGADLANARLDSADLRSASLDGADLYNANLDTADLRGANLSHLGNWRDIRSIKLANIWGVYDPPDGFLAWADSMGAVSAETDEEWYLVR